jgi:hypothetical protein
MMSLVRSVVIALTTVFVVVRVGWWALPIMLVLVLAETWIRGGPEVRDGFARRLLGGVPFGGAILAWFVIANWLFDGTAAFVASIGPIFAFWIVCCVLLPTWRARRLTPQR